MNNIEKLQQTNDELKKRNILLVNRITDLETSNAVLATAKENADNELDRINYTNESLLKEALERRENIMNSKYNDLHKEYSSLLLNNQELDIKNNSQQEQIKSYETHIDTLNKEIGELRAYKTENKYYKPMFEALEASYKGVGIEKKYEELLKSYKELIEENKILKDNIVIEQNKNEVVVKAKEVYDHINQLFNQYEEKKSELDRLKSYDDLLTTPSNAIQMIAENFNMKRQVETTKRDYSDVYKDLEHNYSRLTDKNKDIRKSLERQIDNYKDIQQKYLMYTKSINQWIESDSYKYYSFLHQYYNDSIYNDDIIEQLLQFISELKSALDNFMQFNYLDVSIITSIYSEIERLNEVSSKYVFKPRDEQNNTKQYNPSNITKFDESSLNDINTRINSEKTSIKDYDKEIQDIEPKITINEKKFEELQKTK